MEAQFLLQQRSDVVLCSVTGDDHDNDAAFDGPDLDEDGLGCFGFCREMNDSCIIPVYDSCITGGWCREYQVLPDRTHPTMMMDSSNGDDE